MSRRKQLNPKPLLKSDTENSSGEMGLLRGQDEVFISERSIHNNEDGTDMMMVSASPSSSTNETITSLSNCSSPSLTSPPPPQPPSVAAPLQRAQSPVIQTIAASSMSIESDTNANSENTTPPLIANLPTLSSTIKLELQCDSVLPKLRLNTSLASDPALQPDAKDISGPASNDSHHQNQGRDDDHQQRSVASITPTASPAPIDVGEMPAVPTVDVTVRVPAFMCGPCGIKFSSLSTLEAHQTYYCSHRKDADEIAPSSKSLADGSTSGAEPSTKCIRTGKQYACSQCSYSADKKVSLNRHMRMHQSSPAPSSVASNGAEDSSSQIQPIDRYCSDCDIRFSSTKTYRAHKQHYCSGRHRDGTAPPSQVIKSNVSKSRSQSPPESSKSPTIVTPAPPYLALPTNPIVIIPYSLIRGASVLPGPLSTVSPDTANADLTCFILKNGSLHPIAQAMTIPTQTQTASTTSTSPARATTPAAAVTVKLTSPVPAELSGDTIPGLNVTPVELLKRVRKRERLSRSDIITTPLDLSVRRLSTDIQQHHRERSASFSSSVSGGEGGRLNVDIILEGKENQSNDSNSVTPEQIVCAPSLPGSPPLTPSPKRSTQSPRGILAASPNSLPPSLHQLHSQHHHQPQQHHNLHQQVPLLRPLLSSADLTSRLSDPTLSSHPALERHSVELALRLASTTVAMTATTHTNSTGSDSQPPASPSVSKQTVININKKVGGSNSHGQPQIFVKQGVSKCMECNIVFCKYENYLAHKKHYCSARNLDEKDAKPSPPPSPIAPLLGTASSGATAPLAYQQLICAACGIKFTSLDNLNAHQKYYCPKRIEIPMQTAQPKEKCTKCKTMHEPGLACPLNQNIYKCPICDVISSSAAESRRHIDTHAGVKAFRCSICRYKGNTLRGMRTHIRMHFDKKSSDFNEEHYISCILEEDGLEIPSPAATVVPQSSQDHNNAVQPQLHSCDKCNYSSSYKGNVVRHIKLVHSQNHHQPISPSVGEGGESLILPNHTDDVVAVHTTQSQIIAPYSLVIKSEPSEDSVRKSSPRNDDDETDHQPPTKVIKLESSDVDDDIDITSTPTTNTTSAEMYGYDKMQPILASASTIIAAARLPKETPTPMVAGSGAAVAPAAEPKYCHICDIKFNYLNTFIAHKQFYCKKAKPDLAEVAGTTVSPRVSPVASLGGGRTISETSVL